MKLYETVTVNIATCVHVQYIETRERGFLKPASKGPEFISDNKKKFLHEFLLSPSALRDK
jgi:hypothetical protein